MGNQIFFLDTNHFKSLRIKINVALGCLNGVSVYFLDDCFWVHKGFLHYHRVTVVDCFDHYISDNLVIVKGLEMC